MREGWPQCAGRPCAMIDAVSDASLSLLVLCSSVALFVWNRLPVGVVAIVTALALYFTGVLDAATALSGFGDPVVIFIATLFVVSEGLEASGVTAWAGQMLTLRAGTKRARLLVGGDGAGRGAERLHHSQRRGGRVAAGHGCGGQTGGNQPVEDADPVGLCGQRWRAAHLERQPGERDRRRGLAVARAGPDSVTSSSPSSGCRWCCARPCWRWSSATGCFRSGCRRPCRRTSAGTSGTVVDHYGLDRGIHRLRVRSGSPLRGIEVDADPVDAGVELDRGAGRPAVSPPSPRTNCSPVMCWW